MIKLNKTRRGFTLIELILVVAIIIILAGVMALNVTKYRQTAVDAKSKVESGVASFETNGRVASKEAAIVGYGF